ncbi:hypothetical protein PENTCL1PPCAC_19739, partial [Pristionchus entomophagus]
RDCCPKLSSFEGARHGWFSPDPASCPMYTTFSCRPPQVGHNAGKSSITINRMSTVATGTNGMQSHAQLVCSNKKWTISGRVDRQY